MQAKQLTQLCLRACCHVTSARQECGRIDLVVATDHCFETPWWAWHYRMHASSSSRRPEQQPVWRANRFNPILLRPAPHLHLPGPHPLSINLLLIPSLVLAPLPLSIVRSRGVSSRLGRTAPRQLAASPSPLGPSRSALLLGPSQRVPGCP